MTSTNAALAVAGYTTAPSPSYGCKLVLRDGQPVGHFDCQTAWTLPGMREVAAYHAEKVGRPVPAVTADEALADLDAAIGV